jgi:hypothetical protein
MYARNAWICLVILVGIQNGITRWQEGGKERRISRGIRERKGESKKKRRDRVYS